MPMRQRFASSSLWLSLALSMAMLVGCGGSHSDTPVAVDTQRVSPAQTTFPATCASLGGVVIPSAAFTLPTRGAQIDSAVFLSSSTAGNEFGAYCELRGHINPVDTSAPVINFAVNLPNNWNGRAIHFGGSGFDGRLIDGKEKVRLSPSSSLAPLAQGYATYGDDAGHQSDAITDGSFALNDEALANFGRNALKKTRDVAYYLMNARYGSTATRAYFLGTSTGGRDALTYLQHWPADYDGAVVNQPALNYTGARLSNVETGRLLYLNNGAGWLTLAQTLLVQQRVLSACDTLDGLADGVVGNVEACRYQNAAVLDGLRCPGGAPAGDACLSDAQLATVRGIESPLQLRGYALANGTVQSGGFNFLEGTRIANGDRSLGTRPVASIPPEKELDASQFFTGDQWARYFIARNASFDALSLNPANPGSHAARIQVVSALTDASDPDLGPFFAHGGRLILVHGLADEVISTNSTVDYVRRLTSVVGTGTFANQVRFYTVPGMGHGSGVFKPTWNSLDALVAWAESGTPPANPVVVDSAAGTAGRSRPLCEYPKWPQFAGSGDPASASSFSCSQTLPTAPTCAHLPAVATNYRGGDVWGEELLVRIDPSNLAYTITFAASLQRSAGSTRQGKLESRGSCTYVSQENGALFSFGAGGVVQGGVGAPSGNATLPLLAFATTTADFSALASIYNTHGVQYTGLTPAAKGAATRFRSSAATWQTCRDTSAGFMVYDANCSNVSKGYVQYNAARSAFDLFITPSTGGATTSGGTLTGSVIGGMVNGQVVPLTLTRSATAGYGMQIHTPQTGVAPGSADGAYNALSIAGDNRIARLAGTVLRVNAWSETLSYDTPAPGVATSGGGHTGAYVFSSGIYSFSNGTQFELGLR